MPEDTVSRTSDKVVAGMAEWCNRPGAVLPENSASPFSYWTIHQGMARSSWP